MVERKINKLSKERLIVRDTHNKTRLIKIKGREEKIVREENKFASFSNT